MFHPGDIVSYGTNGVCEITEQKRVRLAGQPCDCLILKPVYDQSMTICVPCTSQVLLDRMRPLPTKEELLAMLHEAQNLLHSEFAYILGIEPNAVPQFIAAELGDE